MMRKLFVWGWLLLAVPVFPAAVLLWLSNSFYGVLGGVLLTVGYFGGGSAIAKGQRA